MRFYRAYSCVEWGHIPYSDVLFTFRWVEREKEERTKNQLVAASFTAWQMGSGGNKSWQRYLSDMGLIKPEKMSREMKKKIADKAHKIAERIMKMDKRK